MCRECWKEFGSPKIDTHETRRVADLIKELYELNSVGGPLHIVTDDYNVSDDDVRFCLDEINQTGPDEHWSFTERPENADNLRGLCLDIANSMVDMSEAERTSTIALSDGFWEPSPQGGT